MQYCQTNRGSMLSVCKYVISNLPGGGGGGGGGGVHQEIQTGIIKLIQNTNNKVPAAKALRV